MTVAPEGRRMLRVEARNAQTPIERKPSWIRTTAKMGPEYTSLHSLVKSEGLHTVCQEAGCPNIFECWEDREATFLIGGDICTRRCDFCDIATGRPLPLDPPVGGAVQADALQALGHERPGDVPVGEVVRVAVALAVAEAPRVGDAAVAQRQRRPPRPLALDHAERRVDGAVRGVRLGRHGDVGRRLRQRDGGEQALLPAQAAAQFALQEGDVPPDAADEHPVEIGVRAFQQQRRLADPRHRAPRRHIGAPGAGPARAGVQRQKLAHERAGQGVGRLVGTDEGARSDTEADLVAGDVGTDLGGYSAEESAMHLEPEV